MRSEDQILEMVQERANSIRRRRRALGGASALATLVVCLALVISPGQEGERGVVTADEPATTTTETTVRSSIDLDDDEAPAPTTSATTTTTSLADATTSSISLDESRPGSEAPPATETNQESPPCDGPSLESTVAVGRATYAPGETVRVSLTMSNSSGTQCWIATRYAGGSCLPSMEFAHNYEGDDPGRVHDWFSETSHRDACADREVIPARGQITVWVEAPFVGSRHWAGSPGATNDPPPAGTYTVYVNWGAELWVQGGTTTFTCPESQCTPTSNAPTE